MQCPVVAIHSLLCIVVYHVTLLVPEPGGRSPNISLTLCVHRRTPARQPTTRWSEPEREGPRGIV